MVPRFCSSSSAFIPMPVSATDRVFRSLESKEMSMRGRKANPLKSSPVRVRYFSRSRASEALEMSSRRKISGCEYREWMIRCRRRLTSAWKACLPMRALLWLAVR